MPKMIANQEKISRHRAFWERTETDRPMIGATIATFPSLRSVRGKGLLTPGDLDQEECARELEVEWEQWQDASGDAFWSAFPLWAFPWHSAMAGCPVERAVDNFWVDPAAASWDQLESVRFDPANRWHRRLLEMTEALKERSSGRFPVGVGPLMMGPADIMMEWRGREALALDLYDAPDRVMALGQACARLCIDAAEALFDVAGGYAGGFCGTSRYLWAPGKMVETTEDISFMMSLAAHRRFVAPLHAVIGRHFPCTVLHLHSAQLHTVPNLLEIPEIGAIEITPDFGEDMLPHLDLLSRVLERKPLILHGIMSVDSMREMARTLPSRGFAMFRRCDSPAEARELLGALL